MKREIRLRKCSECNDFHPYGNGGVCGACGGAITWSPNEEIKCIWKSELIKIPEGKIRIIFKINKSGIDEAKELNYNLETYTYFRKPRVEYAAWCAKCVSVEDMRKIAWSREGSTLHECMKCKTQCFFD